MHEKTDAQEVLSGLLFDLERIKNNFRQFCEKNRVGAFKEDYLPCLIIINHFRSSLCAAQKEFIEGYLFNEACGLEKAIEAVTLPYEDWAKDEAFIEKIEKTFDEVEASLKSLVEA